MDEEVVYSKRGYLNEDYHLFHLKDSRGLEFEYHYHEFDKIVIFLSGKVSYIIEGVTYNLRPWDMLLISNHLIHKAVVQDSEPYERIIIYVSRRFAEENSTEKTALMRCFDEALKSRMHLLRPDKPDVAKLEQDLKRMENAAASDSFGADVLASTYFLQFLVSVNRVSDHGGHEKDTASYKYDSQIAGVLNFINDNLSADLTVDSLAARSYLSKYYFMRRFKEMTGYTVHNYILLKRVLHASELLNTGTSATRAAMLSGFVDYSTFSRAYKKIYGETPKRTRK